MNVIKPYYFEHPQYGKMRVLTAGGKIFFNMSDLQRVFDKTPEELYQLVADLRSPPSMSASMAES